MKLIHIIRENIPCPFCQNLLKKDEYEFGADFPLLNSNDSFYIRKSKNKDYYELVFEGEKTDSSCRVYFCPICGRKLQ